MAAGGGRLLHVNIRRQRVRVGMCMCVCACAWCSSVDSTVVGHSSGVRGILHL